MVMVMSTLFEGRWYIRLKVCQRIWRILFFHANVFLKFPTTNVPLKFEPSVVLPRPYPRVKKKRAKKYHRVQYVRVWVFLKTSFRNFHLPTFFRDLCTDFLHRASLHLFKKYAKNNCTLVRNLSVFSKNFQKFTKISSKFRILKWIFTLIDELFEFFSKYKHI